MAIDDAGFRQALGQFASGVTVVTTEVEGVAYGMTVSAFSSVSLHPPLVLVCIDKSVATHDAIGQAGRFAVNVLHKDQEELSRKFAARSPDKFTGLKTTRGQLGLPLLDGCMMHLECSVHSALDGGDHTIFVGKVEQAAVGDGVPLLYFRGTYRHLAS